MRPWLAVVGFFLSLPLLVAQESVPSQATSQRSLSISVRPGMELAVGDSADLFQFGVVAGGRLEYGLLPGPTLFVGVDTEYSSRSVTELDNARLSMVGASGIVGSYLSFTPRLRLRSEALAGFHVDQYDNAGEVSSNTDPYLGAGVGLSFLMTPAIDIGLDGRYSNYFNGHAGASVSINAALYLQGQRERQRRIDEAGARGRSDSNFLVPETGMGLDLAYIELDSIFPVFYAYYANHDIGRATISNPADREAEEILVSFFVPQYMDSPQPCDGPKTMDPGDEGEVRISALLTDRLLQITEGIKVAAELTIQYKMRGLWYRQTITETLRVYDRNAMTWDDDRRAAAFVTAKDPVILDFSKRTSGIARQHVANAIDDNLLNAIALHQALDITGLSYVVDPSTPYAEYSTSEETVDFLQFPRQTLKYGAGDCDDLTILFCALMESVGVRTAFLTTPGHIFAAFKVDSSPELIARDYAKPEDLFTVNQEVWIPVEVTSRQEGFLKAWAEGARLWREHSAAGTGEFYPMDQAWGAYEPVGFVAEEADVTPPPADQVREAFEAEVGRFVDQEIFTRVETLRSRLRGGRVDPRARNRLATLYARYGKIKEAELEYEAILQDREYLPALVNLGNLHFMQGNYDLALDSYDRAARQNETVVAVLVGLARTHHRLENYGLANKYYSALEQADQELAQQFSYVASRDASETRASSFQALIGVQVWMEE